MIKNRERKKKKASWPRVVWSDWVQKEHHRYFVEDFGMNGKTIYEQLFEDAGLTLHLMHTGACMARVLFIAYSFDSRYPKWWVPNKICCYMFFTIHNIVCFYYVLFATSSVYYKRCKRTNHLTYINQRSDDVPRLCWRPAGGDVVNGCEVTCPVHEVVAVGKFLIHPPWAARLQKIMATYQTAASLTRLCES